jgi:hypothetical protein
VVKMGKRDRFKRPNSKKKQEKTPILLVVTGENEERYFEVRIKEKKYTSITVDLKNSHGDANPLSVINDFKNSKFEPPFGRSVKYVTIWFNFDFDNEANMRTEHKTHKDGNFNNACDRVLEHEDDCGRKKWKIDLRGKEKYKVVYSNPSFELWILLHDRYQNRFINRDEAFRGVKRLLPGYDKGLSFDSYSCVKSKEPEAIANAKKLEKHQDDIGHDNFHERTPSSTLFYLLEEMDREFDLKGDDVG